MLALKLIIGATVLVAIGYVLRTPPKALWRGGLSFVVMFMVTAAVIGNLAGRAGIVRDDPYGHIAAEALARIEADPAPYILFVGASYSRNALDDLALGDQLQRQGYPVQVINFALEGASLQERDLRLQQLLRAAPHAPEMVFFEISKRFDHNPTYGFEVAKFSNRVIGQFTLPGTVWAVRGLIGQRHQLGLKPLIKNSALLALHTPINLANIGLFSGGSTIRQLPQNPAFDPQSTPRILVDATTRNHGLLAPTPQSVSKAPKWATAFRARQRATLAASGVSRIGYYFPPVIDAQERAYVSARCREYTICIAPDDLELLAQLDQDLWFDSEHLLADGAQIYTSWLARQLETRRALGPTVNEQKLALELRR